MSSLASMLQEIRLAGEARREPALTAVMKRATTDLEASGILGRIPAVGDLVPAFARPNLRFDTVRLSSLLRRGPVIVSFFRGRW